MLDEIDAYVRAAEPLGVSWQETLDEQIVQKILPKCKGASPTVGQVLEQVVRLTAREIPLSHAKAEEMLDGFHQHGFAHEMRNEFAEMLLPVLSGVPVSSTGMGSTSARKEMEGCQGKREKGVRI